jgi:hypothetical protein
MGLRKDIDRPAGLAGEFFRDSGKRSKPVNTLAIGFG